MDLDPNVFTDSEDLDYAGDDYHIYDNDHELEPGVPISVEGHTADEFTPDIIIIITGHGGCITDSTLLTNIENTLQENMQILFTSIPGGITFTRHNNIHLKYIRKLEIEDADNLNYRWQKEEQYYEKLRQKCGVMSGIPNLATLAERAESCTFAVNPGHRYSNYLISPTSDKPLLTILSRGNPVVEIYSEKLFEFIRNHNGGQPPAGVYPSRNTLIEFGTVLQYIRPILQNSYGNRGLPLFGASDAELKIGIISFTCLTTSQSDARSNIIHERRPLQLGQSMTWSTPSRENPTAPTKIEVDAFKTAVEATSHPEFAFAAAQAANHQSSDTVPGTSRIDRKRSTLMPSPDASPKKKKTSNGNRGGGRRKTKSRKRIKKRRTRTKKRRQRRCRKRTSHRPL